MIRAADSSKSAKIVLANIGNWHHIYIGIGIYVVRMHRYGLKIIMHEKMLGIIYNHWVPSEVLYFGALLLF